MSVTRRAMRSAETHTSSPIRRRKMGHPRIVEPAERARVPAGSADEIADLVRSSTGVVAWVETSDELIAWIKQRLRDLDLPQYVLGEHLGLPKSRVSEIVKGRRRVTVRELHKLAELLGPLPRSIVAPAPIAAE